MEFFIIKNDEQHGPFTIDQLREMGIDANTPVWHNDLDNWTLAAHIDELRDMLAYSPSTSHGDEEIIEEAPRAAVPPLWNSSMAGSAHLETPRAAKPKKRRTALWVTLGVVAALAIILTITNPKKDDHSREITNVSRAWVTETVDNFNMNGLIGGVVKTASTWLIRSAVDEYVKVDNYGLFSIGYIDTGAEKTRVSLGILGNVFTFNKDQLGEKINELISKYVQDAIGLGEFLSFDGENLDDMLVDGLMDMIGDRMFGDQPSNNNVLPPHDDSNEGNNEGSSLNLPINDEFLRNGAKAIIREGAEYLMDQVDDIGR